MPELPEVETMRRGLLPTIGGTISDIEIPEIPYRPIRMEPPIRAFRQRAIGKRVVGVERIAKRVLVRLDSGDAIVMQPKMAGLALIAAPPSPQHLRIVVWLSGASVDRFQYWDRRGLGTVHLWSQEQVDEHLGPNMLGPDALTIDAHEMYHRFRSVQRAVKIALLDQKLLAGIGNLYAAEILFRARIHPESRCDVIRMAGWKRIHAATLHILSEAIENEGSTLSDGTYRNAINGEGSYQNQHQVYDREGELCNGCRTSIVQRLVQAQRSTFFCPKCQRLTK